MFENENCPLPFIPDVPPEISEAAEGGRLVVFVGAGASCLAGSPNWDGFADGLLKLAVEKGKLSHSQLDQIKHLNAKIKLFIARSACELSKEDYLKILEPSSHDKEVGNSIYQDIQSISNTIVTTNYDTWLDKPSANPLSTDEKQNASLMQESPIEKKIFHKKADINVDKLLGNTVIHLHGSVEEPENMIMTTKDYIGLYKHETDAHGNDINSVLYFLKKLFAEKTVLFIGYGLSELEILDYILLKKEAGNSCQHFMLQGFYSHQGVLLKQLKEYYTDECGVSLISFNMDKEGYQALAKVLNHWAGEITPKGLLPLEERIEAERWLDE